MAGNRTILGNVAASLGKGVKNLLGPLWQSYGGVKKDKDEESRLARYFEPVDASGDAAATGGTAVPLQKLKNKITALARGRDAPTNGTPAAGPKGLFSLMRALGEPGPSGSSSMPGGTGMFAQPASGTAPATAQTASGLQALTATLNKGYGASSFAPLAEAGGRAAPASGVAGQDESLAYLRGSAASGAFSATGGIGALSPMGYPSTGMGKTPLTGLSPLAAYFEGYSGSGMGGTGYFSAPTVIPPAPPGGGSNQKLTAEMDFIGMGFEIPVDPAVIRAEIERHERYDIHCTVVTADNGGGF